MRTTPMHRAALLALLSLTPCASSALAQEAMYTAAATMPGPGNLLLRVQPHYYRYGSNPVTGSDNTSVYTVMNTLQIGLVKDLSLTIDAPVSIKEYDFPARPTDNDAGIEDVDLMLKWRFYRSDPGGIDTTRAAVLFGAKADTDEEFNLDPHLGVVFTQVAGQFGWNAELHYTLTTGGTGDREANLGGEGTADAFNYNLAGVYRFWPERFSGDSTGAWYTTGEFNGLYETNGDHELHFSPGIMYEGRRFGFEVMLKLPVWQDVDERAELDWAAGFGFRFLF